jgi:chromosome segregation ATPase
MSDTPESAPVPEPPAEGGSGGRKMIDVKGMLQQASTRVSVDTLVQKGKKYISLLSKERIEEMINQAAKNIIDKYRAMAAGIADVPVQQVEAESKAEFTELFDQYKQTQKAKTDLEQSKAALDAELEEMRKDLEKQKALADGRLNEEAEKALIVGFKEFERELEKQVVKVFDKRKLILQENDPEAAAELKQVEAAIRPIIANLVSGERERFRMSGGQSRETLMMEKRIEKLYAQIGALESALKTLTQSKVYSNQQINNVLRQLGIATEDKNAEKKKEMLKVVLMATKDIKSKAKTLEEKGVTLAKPQGMQEALAAPPSAPAAGPAPSPASPAPPPG